ncbi:hypothetical protein CDAR_98991 [Caerostris darwini]|uniref:Uncharacterized protein n=1 Tax=Caerostris darwini TaxID=1538125 RepID=A0AAV4PZY0_9ARAC|nr:hypothetical protein CDAR_98991 [Caerostris darwini]
MPRKESFRHASLFREAVNCEAEEIERSPLLIPKKSPAEVFTGGGPRIEEKPLILHCDRDLSSISGIFFYPDILVSRTVNTADRENRPLINIGREVKK